jgi:hypothetical protein
LGPDWIERLGGVVQGRGLWPELEGDPDMRARHVSGRSEEERTPSGFLPGWASGRKEVWAEMAPDGLFSIFLFLFSFLFSDF